MTVTGDTLDEANETFIVNLTNPSNATIADAQGLARSPTTTAPTLSIDDVTVTRATRDGRSPTSPSRSPRRAAPVTVDYATANDTATAGTTTRRPAGTLTFTPGETTQTVTVNVNGDTLDEATRRSSST